MFKKEPLKPAEYLKKESPIGKVKKVFNPHLKKNFFWSNGNSEPLNPQWKGTPK